MEKLDWRTEPGSKEVTAVALVRRDVVSRCRGGQREGMNSGVLLK